MTIKTNRQVLFLILNHLVLARWTHLTAATWHSDHVDDGQWLDHVGCNFLSLVLMMSLPVWELHTEERVWFLFGFPWQTLGFGACPHHWQSSALHCWVISVFNRRYINRNWHGNNDNDRLPVTSLLPCYSSCLQTNTERGTNGLLMGFVGLLLIKPLATRTVCLYKTSAPVWM